MQPTGEEQEELELLHKRGGKKQPTGLKTFFFFFPFDFRKQQTERTFDEPQLVKQTQDEAAHEEATQPRESDPPQ